MINLSLISFQAAMLAVADARAKGLQIVASSLATGNGRNAASLAIAEQYVLAFKKLARTNNTLILPKNAEDISGVVGSAMAIYKQVAKSSFQGSEQESLNHITEEQILDQPSTTGNGKKSKK